MQSLNENAASVDLTALAWVREELRKTLETAHKALRRYLRDAEATKASDLDDVEPAVLRHARQHIHQGVGALELINVPEAALLLRASEALVQRHIGKPYRMEVDAVEAIEKATFAVLDYLTRLLAGRAASPLALFPQLRTLLELSSAERVHPADLWSMDWRWRDVPGETKPPRAPDSVILGAFEKRLLSVVRSEATEGARSLALLCQSLASTSDNPRTATFWRIACAYFEAWAWGRLVPDVFAKRTASRVLSQLRAQIRGDAEVSERLAQDLLFYCSRLTGEATDPAHTGMLTTVRQVYGLTDRNADLTDYIEPSLGRYDPSWVQQGLKRVENAKDVWAAVSADEMQRIDSLGELFSLVADTVRRLYAGSEGFVAALQSAVNRTASSRTCPAAELAMEVATSLLYLEASIEEAEFESPEQAERMGRLAARLDSVLRGRSAGAIEPWMEELYRRVADHQTMSTVVKELRQSLSDAEQQIDRFFRAPTDVGPLRDVPIELMKMRGVLSVLGVDPAVQTVLRMRDDIQALIRDDGAPAEDGMASFHRLADNLGALGFLIDMLNVQPQAAKSLFQFDVASGLLAPVMGRQHVEPEPEIEAAPEAAVIPVLPSPVPAPVPAPAPVVAVAPPVLEPLVRPSPLAASIAPVASPSVPVSVVVAPVPEPRSAPALPDIDPEMLGIFLEEANEVIGSAREALTVLQRSSGDVNQLTILRRAFHTLKGSSRMVGLGEFGEAAWACEQLYNRWLAEPMASHVHDLIVLTDDVLGYFAAWVESLSSSGAVSRFLPEPVVAGADALRLAGELMRVALPSTVDSGEMLATAVAAEVIAGDPDIDLEFSFGDDRPVFEELEPTQPAPFDLLSASAEPALLPAAPAVEVISLDSLDDLEGIDINLFETPDTATPAVSVPMSTLSDTELVAALDGGDPALVDLEGLDLGSLSQLGGLQFGTDEPVSVPAAMAEVAEAVESEPLPAVAEEPGADATIDVVAVAELSFNDLPGLSQLGDLGDWSVSAPAAPAEAAESGLPELHGLSQLADLSGLTEQALTPQPSEGSLDNLPELRGLTQLGDLASLDGPSGLARDPVEDLSDLPALHGLSQLAPLTEESAAGAEAETELPPLLGLSVLGGLDETPVDVAPVPEEPVPAVDPVIAQVPTGFGEGDDEDEIRVIGSLRLQIPLFNIYLNEADELSRRLGRELAEWAMELHRPVGAPASSLAHKLAGSSATVGFTDLSQLARELEHAIDRINLRNTRGALEEAMLFIEVSDDIHRLLHQFAAGFLQSPKAGLIERLQHCAHDVDVQAARKAAMAAEFEASDLDLPLDLIDGGATVSGNLDFEVPAVVIDTGLMSIDSFASIERTVVLDGPPSVPAAAEVEPHVESVPGGLDLDLEVGPASVPAAGPVDATDYLLSPTDFSAPPLDAVQAETVTSMPIDLDLELGLDLGVVPEVVADPEPLPDSVQPGFLATDIDLSEAVDVPLTMASALALSASGVSEGESGMVPLLDFEHSEGPLEQEDAVDEQLFQIFVEEADELVPTLAEQLRQWAANPADLDSAKACMRHLHTFKGGARLAGAMRLGEMAHRFESAIERLVSAGVIHGQDLGQLEQRMDVLATAFEDLRHRMVPLESMTMLAAYEPSEFKPRVPAIRSPAAPVSVPSPVVAPTPVPVAPLPAPPTATTVPTVRPDATPPPAVVRPALATGTSIDWTRFARPVEDSVRGGGERVALNAQPIRVKAQLLDRLVNLSGEVNINRSRVETEVGQLRSALGDLSDNLERLHRQLNDVTMQAETQMESRMEAYRIADQAFDSLEMDRYTRLQELTRMMAESVNDVASVRSTLQRTLQVVEDELATQARLTRELQSDLLRTRMVEFDSISDRLYRLIRLAGKETGKQVRLDIHGSSIGVDRSVLDRMVPAFEHLLRNCVTHGIEAAEQRVAAGKNPLGQVSITARQDGSEVSVEITDDGAGLNLPRIRDKAIGMGLIQPEDELSETDLSQLIFAPGLSTQAIVTELAGRGVGMDVVRTDVYAMGGRIETQTQAGKGTTFRLVLPVTTVVSQIVMLRAGAIHIAIPSNLIERIDRPLPPVVVSAGESGQFQNGLQQIPFYWLGALLGTGSHPEYTADAAGRAVPVVIVRSAQQRLALHVDEVLGNHEVVVKNLGPQLSHLPGLAGITLLATGEVALIYNPLALAAVYGLVAHQAMRRHLGNADSRFAEPEQVSAALAVEPSERSKPMVLVVDDSLTVRRVTKRLLEREGFRVELAKDGIEALEMLANERPQVVLSDIEMPRMDGFDLLRNIRNEPTYAQLPVIMITSRIAAKHREHAMQLGASHYLGKPYDDQELLGLLRGYTRAGKASA
jgi:chemosensory pili system protein ChpA (sensor histidine kinase/response regulator)